MAEYTVGSLFSGIGMIDYAFEQVLQPDGSKGFKVVWQVEKNDFCIRVLDKHWPRLFRVRDVHDAGAATLCPVDICVGGFPCQDLSNAGKGEGIKVGNRSGLWFEFARIIGELRPRYVFLENVPPVTTRGGTTVLAQLAEMGFDAEWGIIPASAAGAPHKRERWFCVADSNGRRRLQAVAGDETGFTPGSDTLEHADGSPAGHGHLGTQPLFENSAQGNETQRASLQDQDARDAQPGLRRIFNGYTARLDAIRRQSRWPAPPGSSQYSWEAPRISRTRQPNRAKRLEAIGNSVVWQVIAPFAAAIWQALEEEEALNG